MKVKQQRLDTDAETRTRTGSQTRTMVEPKVENKNTDAWEKKGHWNKYNKKPKASTQDTGEKEKFKGANNDMNGNVFLIGRNQADVHTTTMSMFEIQVGMKYTASVVLAVQDLVVKPKMLKLPDKPELLKLTADREVLLTVMAVPDNLMDLYKEEVKIYAREKKRFELDCQSVYLLVKG